MGDGNQRDTRPVGDYKEHTIGGRREFENN